MGVERDHAVGVEIRALAVGAVKAVGWIAGRQKYQAALHVDGGKAPQAWARSGPSSHPAPKSRCPARPAGATVWKRQTQLPCAHVVRARIAARTARRTFLRGRTDDHQVAIDGWAAM